FPYTTLFRSGRVADRSVREPHPVGVVERPRPAQRPREPGGIGEIQRPGLDGGTRGGPAGMAGDRAHPAACRLQFARYGCSGVAERPGHDVEVAGLPGHRRGPSWSGSALRDGPRGASRVAVAYGSPRLTPWFTITTGRGSLAACRT